MVYESLTHRTSPRTLTSVRRRQPGGDRGQSVGRTNSGTRSRRYGVEEGLTRKMATPIAGFDLTAGHQSCQPVSARQLAEVPTKVLTRSDCFRALKNNSMLHRSL